MVNGNNVTIYDISNNRTIFFEDSVASYQKPEEIRINPESSSGTTDFYKPCEKSKLSAVSNQLTA